MTRGGREAPRGPRNPTVAAAARLHRSRERHQTGLTLLEGPHLLAAAIGAGHRPERVFASPDDEDTQQIASATGIEVVVVDDRAMQRLAGTENPRGPVAVIAVPEERLEPGRNLLVAHGVSEPGNVGSLVRTSASFGWGFAWTPGTADPWSPKALRAGAGGQFLVPMSWVDVGDLAPWARVATVVTGGVHPASLAGGPWAVLVGEEAGGLPKSVVAACEHRVTISMPGGTESINAGVAAGIVVYELSRS